MRVGLVAMEGCFGAGVVSVLDLLRAADALREGLAPSIPPIDVHIVGARRRVSTSTGVILPVSASLRELDGFDVVVVGALGCLGVDDLLAALAAPDTARLLVALRAGRHGGGTPRPALTPAFFRGPAALPRRGPPPRAPAS